MIFDEYLVDYLVMVMLFVVWGEMDVFQYVNNMVYFRYFESVRLVLFRQVGFEKYMQLIGEGSILVFISCRFWVLLKYFDQVIVGTCVIDMGDDCFIMLYCVVSYMFNVVAVDGEGLIVCYNYKDQYKVFVFSFI